MKTIGRKKPNWVIGFLCVLAIAAYAVMTWASAPVNVSSHLIGRGTYDRFKVQTEEFGHGLFDYMAQAKPAIDMVVQTHDYAPGASTGWHTHPGPVFITVTEGQLTFYEVDDPTCSPTVVKAGEGYVDTGHGHIGRNETANAAKDVAVVIAPVGAPFRSELPAPGPYCAF